jgi:hypothetical protein
MCGCRNGNSSPQSQSPAQQFDVKLPSGETVVANSEHEARVMVTRAGGGTFSKR